MVHSVTEFLGRKCYQLLEKYTRMKVFYIKSIRSMSANTISRFKVKYSTKQMYEVNYTFYSQKNIFYQYLPLQKQEIIKSVVFQLTYIMLHHYHIIDFMNLNCNDI